MTDRTDWGATWSELTGLFPDWKRTTEIVREWERACKDLNQEWLLESVRVHWRQTRFNSPKLCAVLDCFRAIAQTQTHVEIREHAHTRDPEWEAEAIPCPFPNGVWAAAAQEFERRHGRAPVDVALTKGEA